MVVITNEKLPHIIVTFDEIGPGKRWMEFVISRELDNGLWVVNIQDYRGLDYSGYAAPGETFQQGVEKFNLVVASYFADFKSLIGGEPIVERDVIPADFSRGQVEKHLANWAGVSARGLTLEEAKSNLVAKVHLEKIGIDAGLQ